MPGGVVCSEICAESNSSSSASAYILAAAVVTVKVLGHFKGEEEYFDHSERNPTHETLYLSPISF